MIKKVFIGIIILFVVLVLAAIAAVMFIDVNRFKPNIESFVKDNYQRTLSIDGDLSLKLYPRIAVELPATRLSDPNADSTAFSIGSARVSVALMPLLTGKVEADKVQLADLNAVIVRRADGTMSIDDLTGAGKKPADPDAPQAGGAPPDFNIGGIALTNATVKFQDDMAKNTVLLKNLNLETGALANNKLTPLKLTVDVSATNPPANAAIVLDGQVQADLATSAFKAPELNLEVKGRFDTMPINQLVKVSGLSGSPNAVSADAVELNTRVAQAVRKVQASLKFPLSFDLNAGVLGLKSFSGQINVDDPALGAQTVSLPFTGNATVNTKKEVVNLVLKVAAPDTALDAKVDVNGFAKPRIKFNVAADKIDVDRYFPVAEESEDAPPGADKPTGKKAPAQAEAPIDLSALNNLNIDGTATIGKLTARGLKVSNVKVVAKAAGGVLKVSPMQMDLYGGKMKGAATVNAKGNKVALVTDLLGVNIGPLVTDLTKDQLIEGNGEVKLNVTTAGPTVTAMKKALGGTASMALRDGAIVGINLGQKIRDAKQFLGKGDAKSEASDANQKTDFAALTASFKIANGVATNTDLSGKSPLFRLGGGGKIDIAAGSLDYTARAAIVGTSKGQGGADSAQLRGVELPVRLTGPFETLGWKIDWTAAAKAALKSKVTKDLKEKYKVDEKKAQLKAQADAKKAELKAKQDAKKQELKDKAADKIGGKLKGLLGN